MESGGSHHGIGSDGTSGYNPWVLDTGATSHMASLDGILLTRLPPCSSSIIVGNGHSIPVVSHGTSILPTANTSFHLNNILVAADIARNLLSVRQFTRDNHCSIKFNALSFSVKDPWTGRVILRCNSSGDLYTISPASPSTAASCSLAVTSTLWHHRLGHPSDCVVTSLRNMSIITCNKTARSLCHACQLGKHTRLTFASSVSITSEPFALVHCDVWTSPVPSTSGYKYYLVMLDDFTHYCWSFQLRQKSEVYGHFVDFIAYAQTQFGCVPKCFQADNGTEFVNHAMSSFLSSRGVLLRLSCPYTSSQNAKAERMLRTINIIRTLLIHASMPPSYWAEALATATFLLNRGPSSSVSHQIPYQLLHCSLLDCSQLHVFGCLCYPNLSATAPTNMQLTAGHVSSSVIPPLTRVTVVLTSLLGG